MADEIELPVAETPPIAINPAKWQAIALSLAIALVTAYGVVSNLLIYASTRDIAGLIVYLRGDAFLQGISAIALIGGFGAVIFRALRRKARELFLEQYVPPSVAYLKGSVDDPAVAPPTRARETTTAQPATRLVSPTVLHRGIMSPAQAVAENAAAAKIYAVDDEVKPELDDDWFAGAVVSKGDPAAAQSAEIEGNAGPAFHDMYDAWIAKGGEDSFGSFLRSKGWVMDPTLGKWVAPTSITTDALMRAGGVDPAAPFDRGAFPSDMRRHPSELGSGS